MKRLDVLVVYSSGLAYSASVADDVSTTPFSMKSKRANYNLSYAYFLERCQRRGLRAGLASSADVIASGSAKGYWTYSRGSWRKNNQAVLALQVFDKLSPTTSAHTFSRNLLFGDDGMLPFNDPVLFDIFFDKLSTYETLADFSLPTVALTTSTTAHIERAIRRLERLIKNHSFPTDFAKDMVLKDRFGSGGNLVYKIASGKIGRIQTILRAHPKARFVLQPFLPFETGFSYNNRTTATDIRLIILRNRHLQSYVRMAKDGDFRCNEHQGGQLEYVHASDIPESIHHMSRLIIEKLGSRRSMYALDFVVSNSGRAYCLEGNTGPGLDWDVTKRVNEQKSKQLIRHIVDELDYRASRSRTRSILAPDAVPTLAYAQV